MIYILIDWIKIDGYVTRGYIDPQINNEDAPAKWQEMGENDSHVSIQLRSVITLLHWHHAKRTVIIY